MGLKELREKLRRSEQELISKMTAHIIKHEIQLGILWSHIRHLESVAGIPEDQRLPDRVVPGALAASFTEDLCLCPDLRCNVVKEATAE